MEKWKSVASIGLEGIEGELWEIYTIISKCSHGRIKRKNLN
jgi:hypothetical protein